MSQLLTDDSEVVDKQSGETEEAMKQEGLLSSRRKEKTEFEDTQTHDETGRKAMEFDRPGEEELEAAGSGMKDNVNFQGPPPHVGNHREWKANNLVDLVIG